MNLFKPQTTTLRDGCVINSILVINPALKRTYENVCHMPEVKAKLSAGVSSGLIAHMLSQPFNAIKMQGTTATNIALVTKQIYTDKGILGFYSNSLGRCSRLISGLTLISALTPLAMDKLAKVDAVIGGFFDRTNRNTNQIQSEITGKLKSMHAQ